MGYCKYCGAEVAGDAVFCIHCGRSLVDEHTYSQNDDSGSFGYGVLGFFIPLAGIILYLVWHKDKPKSASMAGKGAVASIILSFVLGFCLGLSNIF